MKKTIFLLLMFSIAVFAAPKGTASTNWTYTVRFDVQMPGGGPPAGPNNFPVPNGNADRASSGGFCTWADSSVFFATWFSDVSEGCVSDTFFPGDQAGYNHKYYIIPIPPLGIGYYDFFMDNFADVGRMLGMELAVDDTLHVRLMAPDGLGSYYIWAIDTVFTSDPGGNVEITAVLMTSDDFYDETGLHPPTYFPCFPDTSGGTDVEDNADLLPQNYDLAQNSPNPFNSATEIQYAIPEDAEVSVDVFDITGHKVKSLVQSRQSAGYYTVKWDGTDDSHETVASGTYFYHIRAGEFEAKKRMLYIK